MVRRFRAYSASNQRAPEQRLPLMTLHAEPTVDSQSFSAAAETTCSDEWRAAITLRGEFDLANCRLLRSAMTRHLDAGRHLLRIDVSAVTFIDCTAINELVVADQRCRAAHGFLIITGISPQMRRLFTITGLDRELLIDTAST